MDIFSNKKYRLIFFISIALLTCSCEDHFKDSDSDGVSDAEDSCKSQSNKNQSDIDGDGIGDQCDNDRDGDGVLNGADIFPDDPAEWSDLDNDRIGDNQDDDVDGDGVINEADDFPLDANESLDTDGDGIGNNVDLDDDNDGYPDRIDDLPTDPNEYQDADGDGVGDNTDELPYDARYSKDSDGDLMADEWEEVYNFNPLDSSDAQQDTDLDGVANYKEFMDSSDPRDGLSVYESVYLVNGTDANYTSTEMSDRIFSIGSDGIKVAFVTSEALVESDKDTEEDIYLRDTHTGVITLESDVRHEDIDPVYCNFPQLSGDEKILGFVCFYTQGTISYPKIYIKDLSGEQVNLLTDDETGEAFQGYLTGIDYTGNYLTLDLSVENENEPSKHNFNIFRLERVTGILEAVSQSKDGALGDGNSFTDAISNDGRYILFSSTSTNLVPDTDYSWNVYLKDMHDHSLVLVNTTANGEKASTSSSGFGITQDGRYAFFGSRSANMLTPGAGGSSDSHIYRKDVMTGDLLLLDQTSSGEVSNGDSRSASVSDDGQFVAFSSSSDNLVPGLAAAPNQIYIKNLATGVIRLVSRRADGEVSNSWSSNPAINFDGTIVYFSSETNNFENHGGGSPYTNLFKKRLIYSE